MFYPFFYKFEYRMRPITKKELQLMYGISRETLLNWLKLIPENFYEKIKTKQILQPKELEIIFHHWGLP